MCTVPGSTTIQVDAWSGWNKPLSHLLAPELQLIYGPQIEDIPDIKLVRRDTILHLSQKAKKLSHGHLNRYLTMNGVILSVVVLCNIIESLSGGQS